MKKRIMLFLTMSVLLVISISGVSFAFDDESLSRFNIERKLWSKSENLKTPNKESDMLEAMKNNGYEDVAKYIEDNDYEAMDKFMNNLTDEDYENMIKLMKTNGFEDMAKMMEGIDKDQMIKMHNSMGGAKSCHSDSYSNMMGF